MTDPASNELEFIDGPVTVVIPFCAEYTPETMLDKAIESVESQTAVDTEAVVIEDGDERGPAWARNVGLQRAETRYVAFLDADDIWLDTKLRDQLQRMDETEAGMCVDGETEYTPIEFVGALLTGETSGLTSSILIDTEQVDARFDESLSRREDHLYMIEAAMQGGICFCPKTFITRNHEDGLSNYVDTTPQNIREFFRMAVEVAPGAQKYRDTYYRHSYVVMGRYRHFDGEYRTALRYFVESLRYGPSVDAIGALGITLLTILYQYPSHSVRQLNIGGVNK